MRIIGIKKDTEGKPTDIGIDYTILELTVMMAVLGKMNQVRLEDMLPDFSEEDRDIMDRIGYRTYSSIDNGVFDHFYHENAACLLSTKVIALEVPE